MASPIQRNGTWWHRNDQGHWHRWDATASAWMPVGAPPPPPPPPAAGSVAATPGAPPSARTDVLGSAGRSRKWLAASVAIVIVTAAAGGYLVMRPGDEASAGLPAAPSGGSPPPSRPAHRIAIATRIEQLCRATEARSKELMPPKNEAEMNELVAITKSFSEKVRKLDPPKRFHPLLEHFDRGVASLERGLRTAAQMDPVIQRMRVARAAGDRVTFSGLMSQAEQLGAESAALMRSGARELKRSSRAARAVGIDC